MGKRGASAGGLTGIHHGAGSLSNAAARRTMTYPALCSRFREVAAEYGSDEQRAMFNGTAARLYGITP